VVALGIRRARGAVAPRASSPDIRFDSSASASVRDGVRKLSKVDEIIERVEATRRLNLEGTRRG
jgi:hypothetical protein